ncbi:ATP-dependent DNA helicase [Heracleum sosnowskyi]|uniref:ATP-dependent DNA helicase n=1 Tax=Heracleum sosnowskyi TaxID=360622 RepID=A0AAD8IQT6_9APIA|nr:ATP-dependent DNA helicase [Heracleum sosnowskyi]
MEGYKILPLLENMRVEANVPPVTVDGKVMPFKDWMLAIGNGVAQTYALDDDIEPTLIKIPKEMQVTYSGEPIKAIADEIYGGLHDNIGNIEYLWGRAILTPLNEYVDKINREVLERLLGNSKLYKSCDTIYKSSSTYGTNEVLYPSDYLNTLKFSGMPNHELEIKEGVPIMLLRNINPKKGLCNGTRLIVTRCYPFLIEGLIITENKLGEKAFIPRITMSPADKTLPFVLKRKQFPISVCYAMTINKSQGQTVKNVGLYLPDPVFSHGKLYVVVSRVTSPLGLKIVCVDADEACADVIGLVDSYGTLEPSSKGDIKLEVCLINHRFRVNAVVQDSSGKPIFTLFNKEVERLIRVPIMKIIAEIGQDKLDNEIPPVLRNMVGQKCLFEVKANAYNQPDRDGFTVARLSENPQNTTTVTSATTDEACTSKKQRTG